jgi:glutamate/aspartate transport system substrate-binding protein
MVHSAKKLFKASWLLALSCAFVLPVQAQKVLERIKQRNSVTIGYRDDASPFSFKDKDGNPQGYAVELCQAMAPRLAQQAGLPGATVRYLAVPVDQIERYVKGANVDLFCSATSDTAERRKSMDFSAPVFVTSVKVLVRKQDNIKAVADLGGKTLAVIDKTTAAQTVASYAAQKGLAISVAKSVGADAALGQLRLGWVVGYARDDVLLAAQLAGATDGRDYTLLAEPLASENIAIAFPPGDAVLAKAVNQSLLESYKSGTLAASYDRWFTKPIAPSGQSLSLPMPDSLKVSLERLK